MRQVAKTAFGCLAVTLGLAAAYPAAATDQRIGNWIVSSEKDPFSPKRKTVAALAYGQKSVLAIRCFPESGLSVVVLMDTGDKHFDAHAPVNFKYRADEGPIVEDKGEAFGENTMVEMPNSRQILDDAGKASTLYVRMQTPADSTFDMSFKPRGATKALAAIRADCPPGPANDAKGDDAKDATPKK